MQYHERVARARHIRERTQTCPWGGWVVVFDIPETHAHARRAIRRLLKSCGFRKLQRSVWYCSRDVGNDAARLLSDLGFDQWVHLIQGEIH